MTLLKPFNRIKTVLLLLLTGFLCSSCQKEVNGLIDGGGSVIPVKQKPKVGTVWTYHYYTYNTPGAGGGIKTSIILTLKAKSEDVLGGEKWLNIVDVATDTTVFLLNEKPGGLYQYTNNKSYLLCKDPAAVNDTYNTFNNGSAEDFTVKLVKDTLPTGIGDIPVNYYEGVKLTYLVDQVWYNEYAWIVRKQYFISKPGIGTWVYYRFSTLFLDKIEY
ncbi:hypothetical protein [Ferruginibacter profundus]